MTDSPYRELRAALATISRIHISHGGDPLDLITALSGILYAQSILYARRTGDYSGATRMDAIAHALDRIEEQFDTSEPLQRTVP